MRTSVFRRNRRQQADSQAVKSSEKAPLALNNQTREMASVLWGLLERPTIKLNEALKITAVTQAASTTFTQLRVGQSLTAAFGKIALTEKCQEVCKNGLPDSLEVQLGHPTRVFEIEITPINGRGLLLSFRDRSGERNYEELRAQFAASVSHELRTPLAAIRGLSETLADPHLLSPAGAPFAARLAKEVTRLERLIEELLLLASLEQGLIPAPIKPYPVAPLIDTLVSELQSEAQEGATELRNAVDGALTIHLDKRLATTVFRNLLQNAITHAGPKTVVEVGGAVREDAMEFWVVDNGVGIPARQLPHIFERFFRGDPARSKRGGSSGLGLSIVKHIIESYAGEVSAQSQEGLGTKVSFSLKM